MRRLVSFFSVLIVVIIASPLLALAAGSTTYDLDDLGLSIVIPDSYIVFTRSIKSNDPHLSEYGLTKDGMESLMKERNIYLNAWDEEVNFEIIVTMTENSIKNFSPMSDTVLETLATSLSDQYRKVGISFIKSEVYQHQQAKFLKIYISQPNNDMTVYGLQYYTVYDGKAINITLQSYSGDIDASKESVIKSIVDSIQFYTDPIQNSVPTQTPSFVFIDKNTGVKFTIPANWSQAELSKEREFISAKFSSNLEGGLTILFGGHDLWNELSAADKQGLSRNDLNNSAFSKSDIADMLGLQAKDISTVTYGGKEYFKGIVTSTQSAYGITMTITMTHLYYFDNGYIYLFQFNGTDTNPYYKDFEALLSSVEYPYIASNVQSDHNQVPALRQAQSSFFNSWFGLFLINLLITILIHPTPVWIYRYVIRKKPVSPKAAKRIVIVDAIVVALIMFAITAMNEGSRISIAAVLLWSRVCYSSLTKGFVESLTVPQDTASSSLNDSDSSVPYSSVDSENRDETTTLSDVVPNSTSIDIERGIPAEAASNKSSEFGLSSNTESSGSTDAQIYDSTSPKIRYCRKCGFQLLADSSFCSHCGTKVIEANIHEMS